jgi:hypothetical protein
MSALTNPKIAIVNITGALNIKRVLLGKNWIFAIGVVVWGAAIRNQYKGQY